MWWAGAGTKDEGGADGKGQLCMARGTLTSWAEKGSGTQPATLGTDMVSALGHLEQ